MRMKIRGNDGMSLVMVMMVVAITGILAVVISQMLINSRKESMILETQIDRMALNRYLITAVNCAATKDAAPNPCADGTYVDVMPTKGASILVKKFLPENPDAATKIGKWTVRAKCGPSNTLVFEAKLTTSGLGSNTFKDISPDVPFGCVMP